MIRNKWYKWKLNSLGLNVDSVLTCKLFFYEEEIIILGDTLVKARCKRKDIRDEGVDGTILKINPEGVNSIYKKDNHKYKDQVKLSKLRELKQASSNLIFINTIFEFRSLLPSYNPDRRKRKASYAKVIINVVHSRRNEITGIEIFQ